MNFLTIFYKKPKNWFKLNKGILFSVYARWAICFLCFYFFWRCRVFWFFEGQRLGRVYLAQNLYREREQSEIVGGGSFIVLFIYCVGILVL